MSNNSVVNNVERENADTFIERISEKYPDLIEKYSITLTILSEEETHTNKVLTLLTHAVNYFPEENLKDNFFKIISACSLDADELKESLKKVSQEEGAGFCWNFTRGDKLVIVSKDAQECAVGIVRKYRNEVKVQDSTCWSCPYFISGELFKAFVDYILLKDEHSRKNLLSLLIKRRHELY